MQQKQSEMPLGRSGKINLKDGGILAVLLLLLLFSHYSSNSHNQVRGHRTGSSHSGAEEYPREKQKQPKVVHAYIGLVPGMCIPQLQSDWRLSCDHGLDYAS